MGKRAKFVVKVDKKLYATQMKHRAVQVVYETVDETVPEQEAEVIEPGQDKTEQLSWAPEETKTILTRKGQITEAADSRGHRYKLDEFMLRRILRKRGRVPRWEFKPNGPFFWQDWKEEDFETRKEPWK